MQIHKTFTSLLLAIATVTAASAAPSKPKAEPTANDAKLFAQGTEKLLQMDYAAAEVDLQAAVKANPDNAEAHNNLAFVLRKQGEDNFEAALEHYNRAVELDADLAEAYMYRGVLYTAMGKKDLALQDHGRLLELGETELAGELEWVIENGREKEPAQFFGVVID